MAWFILDDVSRLIVLYYIASLIIDHLVSGLFIDNTVRFFLIHNMSGFFMNNAPIILVSVDVVWLLIMSRVDSSFMNYMWRFVVHFLVVPFVRSSLMSFGMC